MESAPLKPIKEGQVLNRPWTDYYNIKKYIAKGSYGSVFLVESKIDNN